MFFQKASDPVEEATVAEVIQDQPEVVPRHQELTAVQQYAQVPGQLGQALAEATAAAPLAHQERAQHGQAAQYGKDKAR